MKKRLISLLVLFSLCMALLGACDKQNAPGSSDTESDAGTDSVAETPVYTGEVTEKQAKPEPAVTDTDYEEWFIAFLDRTFEEWITEDSITQNFYLANPEAMGIERMVPTYGEIATRESILRARGETFAAIRKLETVRYGTLSPEMQVIYDIIMRSLDYYVIMEENEDFSYYTGYVRPVTGIQVQLPILLAEFNFYTQQDIEDYLLLLDDTIRYFDDMIEFERERARRGFFMSDENLDKVIEQLESFLEPDAKDSLLISFVNEKIDNFPGLSDDERERYKERNRELVTDNVLVAYENLLEAMISLRGVGPAPGGLASLPDGDRYALASLSVRAGTDRTADDLYNMINDLREVSFYNIGMALRADADTLNKYSENEAGRIPDGSPEEYLLFLQDAMNPQFPPMGDIDYRVLEVHESLSEFLSPAFFLVPAIDVFDNNVIYINPSSINEDDADSNISLFTMLAHEGYPGHMYQMVYQRGLSFHPMRYMLSNTGYTEGWATYVEYLSYYYAQQFSGMSDSEMNLMQQLNTFFLTLQSQIDLGVNLLGWGKDEVAALLFEAVGSNDDEYVDNVYTSITGMPLNSVTYTLGYVEMLVLLSQAQESWGSDFDLMRFHEFILDFGPAPFNIISRNMP